MIRLDNKGQSLVLFVMLLPIMIGIMILVIDCGNVMVKKNEIDNVIEMVLDYGLDINNNDIDNMDSNDISNDNVSDVKSLEVLLGYNLKKCHNEVKIDGNKILIKSSAYVDGVFSKVLGFNGFKIESSYIGYIDNSLVVKEKIK